MDTLWFASRAELLLELVPLERLVALAEPTTRELLDAVREAGRRYVDIGREHDFRLSRGGWRWALGCREVAVLWVLDPELPTCTPFPAGWSRRAAGVPVVVEGHSRRSYGPEVLRVTPYDGGIAVAGEDLALAPLRRRGRPPPRGATSKRSLPAVTPGQLALEAALRERALPVVGATSAGLAFRNPGVPSLASAEELGLPGEPHWSWRDLVFVPAAASGEVLGRLHRLPRVAA